MKKTLAEIPLDYYHCTFFLPLIGLSEEDFSPKYPLYEYSSTAELSDAERQAYQYFSPTLRNILFGSGDDNKNASVGILPECRKTSSSNNGIQPVCEWRLPQSEINCWQLVLEPQLDAEKTTQTKRISTVFNEVRLFRYFNGIYVLAFRVSASSIETDKQLETWLHFTRLARLLYMSFPEQITENKIAPLTLHHGSGVVTAFEQPKLEMDKHRGVHISEIVRFLLKAFAKVPKALDTALDSYNNLHDDRMFVSVAYGLENGDKLDQQTLTSVNYLAAWVDRAEDIFEDNDHTVYAPDELAKMTEDKQFLLWGHKGGVFSFTGYSNSYVYNGWFFRNIIAPNHIPYIYDRMLVQALFYQASLRLYDDKISVETHKLVNKNQLKNIKKQRENFILFTNQYWFHELTQQLQGKQIFDLQMQGLELQKHYDIIKDELERTDEYLQANHNLRVERLSRTLTRGGLAVALVALYYTLFSILEKRYENLPTSLWDKADQLPFFSSEWWLLGLIPAVIGVGGYFVMGLFSKFRRNNL